VNVNSIEIRVISRVSANSVHNGLKNILITVSLKALVVNRTADNGLLESVEASLLSGNVAAAMP
jgi:hypothetical protein